MEGDSHLAKAGDCALANDEAASGFPWRNAGPMALGVRVDREKAASEPDWHKRTSRSLTVWDKHNKA